jgi:hypothetical protein
MSTSLSDRRAARRPRRRAAHLLPDDGIIDEVAVSIAVSGTRRVRLTEAERDLAAERMIRGGADLAELAQHLGTSTAAAGRLIRALGYRLSMPEPRTGHRWIVPDAQAEAGAAA